MNISKLKIIFKLINPFGGFASAFDYVLGCLNTWLTSDKVAANVEKTYGFAKKIYSCMIWLGKFCPARWEVAYKSTCASVEKLVEVFADGKVNKEEICDTVVAFKLAYADWMADDIP